MSNTRLGVDTGGTFTDFVWLDPAGQLHIHKTLSTPENPAAAILKGIGEMGVPEEAPVVHGSTVATNALLERRGAATALITTAGFTDVLAIGRQNRPDIYALVPTKADPLIPLEWRLGVDERVNAQGEVLKSIDDGELAQLVSKIAESEIESVAICLLYSFLHPAHESHIAARLREAARERGVHISLSSQILPEYREFERTATTVINAYVAPLMSRYLKRLVAGVAPRQLTVMQSNGGVISAEMAGNEAARTCLSGPAGGVVGARYVAQTAGYEQIITFDMGGTSTDVALCDGYLPTTTTGSIAELPLRLPIIDIHTVGAGGGSLGTVDAGGALHVGPQSAGAVPGPASYGRGGEQVTTTDANLVTGRLDSNNFLGGSMQLDLEAAQRACHTLASQMGVGSAESAAWGVLQVANATMERAIRRISVERGFDPRQFTLVPFGGAGPLHACELAENLQIPRVLIPSIPGVLSALGMLVAAPTRDYSQTVMLRLDAEECEVAIAQALTPLQERGEAEMDAEGYGVDAITFQPRLDMRYAGQSHELQITLAENERSIEAMAEKFHVAHERRYGYRQPAGGIEIVTVRLTVTAPVVPPELPTVELSDSSAESAIVGHKQVWFNQQPQVTTLYQRKELSAGNQFSGPAIVFQYDTTIVIPPGWHVRVDPWSNLIVENK